MGLLRLHRTRGPTLERRNCSESVNVWEHLVSPHMTTMPRRVCSSSRPAIVFSTVRMEATMASSWVHSSFYFNFKATRYARTDFFQSKVKVYRLRIPHYSWRRWWDWYIENACWCLDLNTWKWFEKGKDIKEHLLGRALLFCSALNKTFCLRQNKWILALCCKWCICFSE